MYLLAGLISWMLEFASEGIRILSPEVGVSPSGPGSKLPGSIFLWLDTGRLDPNYYENTHTTKGVTKKKKEWRKNDLIEVIMNRFNKDTNSYR